MDKFKRLLEDEELKQCFEKNLKFEKDRMFCKHDLEHSLAVARIAYIKNLEDGLNIDKGLIYAAALLHDIGRWKQYKDGISHDEAAGVIAERILEKCGYDKKEKKSILEAIKNHRNDTRNYDNLKGIIYISDKLSRNCFSCQVRDKCNWSDLKKNDTIMW